MTPLKTMITKRLLILLILSTVTNYYCFTQDTILYKQIDTTQLFMEIYTPEKMDTTQTYPAMVFFFGGGWFNGDRSRFMQHAKYFSKRGLVCFLVDYRTKEANKTSPFESLKDAKSAMRFVRKKALRFHVNPTKIIAAGGSAGGHLAAATALIGDYNESTDDMSVSCIPNALVLFNPVIDNGPGGYGYERIGNNYLSFSPLHNIKKGAPPTIMFLGTNDELIPAVTAEYYKMVMAKVGSRCDLKLYEGQGHAFFTYKNFEFYKKTIIEADEFLVSLGYLTNEPVVKIE